MKGAIILLVEDNPDHEVLTLRALKKAGFHDYVVVVRDGGEALDYLFRREGFEGRDKSATPALVLLDLKLQTMNGLEVLKKMRGDARTRRIPVVVLTSSREEGDVTRSYDVGANSYVRKPGNFEEFSEALRRIGEYWLGLNEAPTGA